jgi:hypothetical protein
MLVSGEGKVVTLDDMRSLAAKNPQWYQTAEICRRLDQIIKILGYYPMKQDCPDCGHLIDNSGYCDECGYQR